MSTRWPPTENMQVQGYSIREYAHDIMAILDQYDGNLAPAYDEVMPVVQRFFREPLIEQIGVLRDGNHTPSSSWLYFDYELEVHLSTFHPNLPIPVHNHGTWEFIAPVHGEFSYTAFRRLDDGSVDGIADLEVAEQRMLRPGDAAVCGPPPNDVHTFTPLTDDVMLLGMNHGPLAARRKYFDVSTKTYEIRHSQAWRLDQAKK